MLFAFFKCSGKEYNGVCEPIPCTKGRGWTGEFMPDCTYRPFCPDEFPGHYPYCNRYALNVTTIETPTHTYLPPPTTLSPTTPSTTRTRPTPPYLPPTRPKTPPPTPPKTPPPTPRITTQPPTRPPIREYCDCCESIARDIKKILTIFETLYGKDIIDNIGAHAAKDLKLKKPFVSRLMDQLPFFG